MPQYVTPSYTYTTRAGQRTFQHRWHDAQQQTYDCVSCTSTCAAHEPFHRHWRQGPQCGAHNHLSFQPTKQQQRQLHLINTHRVEEFILCDRNLARNTKAFIIDAGIHAVPQLLRLLFCNAVRLRLSIGFYATVQQEDLLFQSTALDILHHCDISASVDVLFYLLLRKIKCYVRRYARLMDRNEFKVKRMRVLVTRCLRDAKNAPADEAVVLPIQYRVKHAHANDIAFPVTKPATHCLHTIVEQLESDLVLDTPTLRHYYDHLMRQANITSDSATDTVTNSNSDLNPNSNSDQNPVRNPVPDPLLACNFNLYEFQMCKSSMELFVVPFHLSNAANLYQTRSFVIVNDINGRLRDFVEITNVRRFFQHDVGDHLHMCHSCNETFFQRVDYEFHRMLRCGRGFEILKLERNCIEIYEHCVPLTCDDFDWPLYAVLPPTVCGTTTDDARRGEAKRHVTKRNEMK